MNERYLRCKVEILAIGEKPIKELQEFLHGFNIAGGSVDWLEESKGHLDANNEEVPE